MRRQVTCLLGSPRRRPQHSRVHAPADGFRIHENDWQFAPCKAGGLSPVDQSQRIAELLDALVMGSVARHQFKAMLERNRCDHRIGPADGLAYPLQVAGNPPGQFSSRLVENEDFFRGDAAQESLARPP